MGSTTFEHELHGQHGLLNEPLAIVGVATRFPQDATSTEELWKFLLKGRSAHTAFPADRIGGGHYHPDPEHGGSFAVKGGHFLSEDPALFDAPFFSVTKGEVMALDPQQRVVLENVYHALENAGLPIHAVSGTNTSVYVSGFNHDHLTWMNSDPESTMKYKPTGATNSLLSNRVSWFFDFKSSSVTLDTACSSSMVALHLGCQGLRTRESDMAVISGVTMISFPSDIVSMGHHGFLSQQGRCYSFDHRADGYARGEGVGSLIVKRLSDAVRDRNTIRAVIRGTGVNQDGRTPGISLPSATAQESLIRKVYSAAGLQLADTAMVEAHGTGTAAGDPIEASALARTFGASRTDTPIYVGALKSGIGHLEGGAGVAGIIKGILILESGIIPPNVNFEKVNPKIPIKKWNLQFPLKATPWPKPGLRRISINSFGVGGTNAHTILDDAHSYLSTHGIDAIHHTNPILPTQADIDQLLIDLDTPLSDTDEASKTVQLSEEPLTNGSHRISGSEVQSLQETPCLTLLTSFDEAGVSRIAQAQAEYLRSVGSSLNTLNELERKQFLEDFSYTMSQRSEFPWRRHVVAQNISELIQALETIAKPIRVKNGPRIGFVFTGQGAQWFAMGSELMVYPVYRHSIIEASHYMQSLGASWSLIDELSKSKAESKINEPYLAHPACAALQIALVDLLDVWKIRPLRIVGHSSGEIAAAYCAGKLSRESAWKTAYFRGLVSSRQLSAAGSMMAVALSADAVQSYLDQVNQSSEGELIVACYNSPKNLTISGALHKIDLLKSMLDRDSIFARKLLVKNAYHSAYMREVADEYLSLLGTLSGPNTKPQGSVTMFSSVNGTRIDEDVLTAQYWVDNLVSPVRFADAIKEMCFSRTEKGQASIQMNSSGSNTVFTDFLVEIGPHAALQSAIKEILGSTAYAAAISSYGVLSRANPGLSTLVDAVGQLASRGQVLDLNSINTSSRDGLTKLQPRLLVELPGYTFNHSERQIYESRLSKNFRLRKQPRHDLFGAPVPDWNAETPRWRNILRIDEQPWLRDHIVTNQIVLPGVAYLIAVIEASRQISDPEKKITGFRLRDISLKRALIIPDNKDGIETMLTLTRYDESSLQASSLWRKFVMSSYNSVSEDWTEHCTGYIAVDYEVPENPIDQGLEAVEETKAWDAKLALAEELCVTPINIDDTYDNLVTAGLAFGPLFKNLSNVKGTTTMAGQILGTVTVPDAAAAMPKGFMHEHLIHPSTMDSFMHFFIASVMDATGKKSLDRPMVPTFIKDVWISAELNSSPGTQFYGHGKSQLLAYDKYESDIRVWDLDTKAARIHISGVRATPLEAVDSETGGVRKLNHEIAWVPYLELLPRKALEAAKVISREQDDEYKIWIEKIQTATLLLVNNALKELDGKIPEAADGHLIRYFEWMKFALSELEADRAAGVRLSYFNEYRDDTAKQAVLFDEVAEHNADGKLAVRMGQNIVKVLRKQEDPLHLMFGMDDLLDHVYAQVAHLGNLPALQAALLNIIRTNGTNLRILEVGAGTGGTTTGILEGLIKLSTDGSLSSSVGIYTFTDISSAFFEKAKEKFKRYRDFMEYKVLDIESSAAKQGFDLDSYDIIIAQNVVHATTNLQRTFTHMRELLKSGGKMLLQEGVRQDLSWSTISFGQLPGWWAGIEPSRRMSPWISPGQWDQIIKASGFTGIELDLQDRDSSDLHTQSLFVSTASSPDTIADLKYPTTVIITTQPLNSSPTQLCADVKQYLETKLRVPEVKILHYLDLSQVKLDQVVCLSVCELERSLLANVSQQEYENIKQILCVCKGMIWITGDIQKQPELGMITGLTRSVRWERDIDEANLVTLSISEPKPSSVDLVAQIGSLYRQQFAGSLSLAKFNGEYLLRDGTIFTSRLIEAEAADIFLGSQFSRSKPVMMAFKDAGRPIKLATAAPGLLDKLEWVTDEVYFEPLADTHVEIDIRATAMNFRDLMIAMGEHMAYSMGNEAAGVVTRIGSKVTDVTVGDRVVYLCGLETQGTFHTFGRVDQNVIVRIPDHMSYEVACGLPCVYATVIYGLVDAGRLMRDEKILIHAAAGGVGQAAIHYSKYVGAEIFATVSSPEKRELVKKLGVQDDHIFSSRDLTFVKGIMRATNGKGVDLVLNSLSGEALRRSWDLLAPFGRFVEIGKKDAQNNGKVELRPFLRNVTMTSVELPTMMRHRPSLIKRLTEDTVRLWTEGHIKEADPMVMMNYSQFEEGLRVLQSGRGIGKMIFVPSPDDILPIVPQKPPAYRLREDATYVMAGGLGGIGRSFSRWMAKRGARNILFLSSSGNITPAVSEMIKELEVDGCSSTVVKCDVSDKETLQATLEACRRTLPPIKGVIQGAMKLKDTMFENMTFEDFQLAVKPKVQGSLNLHELLPRDLDFFVMLSSATGVLGNRAQGNYAAGNTFQDALAHHRRSIGLPASTLDLGQVLSVGYVAENRDRAQVAKHLATVLEVIREDEIHVLIEYLMNPSNSPPAQMAAGLTTAELYRQRGMPTPTYLDSPLFTHLRNVTCSRGGGGDGEGGILVEALLNAATTLDEATEIVLTAIRSKLSSLLAVPLENVDPSKSVSSNGVDSLVAMEFRTYLAKEIKADIPVLEIQGTMSLADLSRKIASVSSAVELKEEQTSDTT